MDNIRFAQTIKNARLKKGYTQSQLADLLNVSNKTISKWETGRGYPDITLLAKITSILKLDYEELLQSNEYIIQKRKKKRKDIFIISIVCFIFAITLIGMYKVQKQQKYENNYNNIIQRLCSDYYVGDQLALAYREPASLVVMYSGGLTQKKVIQFCDYLNINDFKKIKTIKTELSFDPTVSYIDRDNQNKQYEFYISNKKGEAIVVIVILNHNIIKILDNEYHQVYYYQSQNINYEKLNIDHLPW
nr:helix-turn-helix transcriptional regulator [uncultured Faecalibacillus sp.]